ncbi:MAG: dynamin family protein [Clostridium sp.]|uniref:dynamin family protein n=1 Tax=Clostridium sp. TaxID=1506 RepID=UPI003F380F09
MKNSEKISKLIQLTDIVKDYMVKDDFLKEEAEYMDKIVNVKDKLENRKFTVSIIAAMKAGKSTTFNALIGRDLLPNERAACTASITEIRHAKVQSDCILKKYVDGRVEKIVAENGKTLEEAFHEDVRHSRKRDKVEDIEKYYVETPIKALEGSEYEELIQNFVLVDTPGPNEADIGDFDVTILQRLALDQLRNSDALIMLLDYESYKSETNAKILQDIFKNRDDLKEDEGKVYFLLNKIDSMGN